MSSGVFLELAEDSLGGTEGAAKREINIGPVGVWVGIVDDRDKQCQLVGVSGVWGRGGIKWREFCTFSLSVHLALDSERPVVAVVSDAIVF